MSKKALHITGCCMLALLLSFLQQASAQFKVRGTVYDSSGRNPLEAVSVISSSGRGVSTDINGKYEIEVHERDSIWFSYLGKPTIKYPILKMTDPLHFDISIMISVPVLREVKVMPRNYRQDSIQNRIDYEKAFNFHRPTVGSMTSIGPTGAGIDIQELIRLFQFRKNRYADKFRERLLQQERDKFVEHRFNKQLVRRLTGLSDAILDSFMVYYRPNYEFTKYSTDYEFQEYIKEAYQIFKSPVYRKEN